MLPTTQSVRSAWITAQNARTQAWLCGPAHLPIRQQVQQRLAQLFAKLHQAEALAEAFASPAGQWRATTIHHPETDLQRWQLWHGAAASAQLCEVINDVYPTGIAWLPDRRGFYYDRYLAYPGSHALYFHQVGTPQRQDRCVFYNAAQPAWYYQPTVSPDGRWLALTILNHSACNRLTLMALADQPGVAEGPPIAIIPHFTGRYAILHWQPDQLILCASAADVPNGRLLAVALGARVELRSLLPQPTLSRLPLIDAAPLGDGWVIHTLRGACAELQIYAGHGAQQTTAPLPGMGTVLWLAATNDPPQLRYCYTDHSRPPQVYCWHPGASESKALGEPPNLPYDPADFVTRHAWIPSTAGALVPCILTHRRDLPPQPCPTLLSAYGGLGHLHTPQFTAEGLVWLALGGIYATVCARGGGELGADWHQAAVGIHKQRTFDDVLAAARWLLDQGITTPSQLGLWGVSNGGLTAGTCLTQAPALFGAVVIEAALLDMLAYPHLGRGADWLAEYGNPADPTLRPVLATYSPLHNIRPGCSYPATLVSTHEHDPRVGEAHSLHFAQVLQAAQSGAAPILLSVAPGSGHADHQISAERLAATTDQLTFLAIHLGLLR